MRSAAVDKAPKNRRSNHATPHNAQLRIIGPAHVNAVAGSVVVGAVGFSDDADAFGLQAEGDDFALVFITDLLERTDGSHVLFSCCVSSPRPPRPRWRSVRPKTIGDAPARAGAKRRTLSQRLSCLARNGRSPGEESRKRRRCGSDDRGAAGLRPDQAITEARCVAC